METATVTPGTTRRAYKYYDLVMVCFVTVLLCSSLIGVGKVCQIAGYSVGAGVFFFPISYVFGDILTEVYGYARSRRVIWAGVAALGFASVMSWAVIALAAPRGLRHGLRPDAADRRRVPVGVLGRRLRQLLRPRQAQAEDRGALPLVADHRLDRRRAGR